MDHDVLHADRLRRETGSHCVLRFHHRFESEALLPETDGTLLYGVRQFVLAAGHLAVSVGEGVAVGACEDLSAVDVRDEIGALFKIGYNMRGEQNAALPVCDRVAENVQKVYQGTYDDVKEWLRTGQSRMRSRAPCERASASVNLTHMPVDSSRTRFVSSSAKRFIYSRYAASSQCS